MKCIDLNTAQGITEFKRLSRYQELRRQVSGLGHLSTRTLVERCAFQLSNPAITGETTEEWAYSECWKDADLFAAYADRYKKAPSRGEEWDRAVLTDPVLFEPLRNLAALSGSSAAKELDNRRIGRPGLYRGDKVPEFLHFVASEGSSAEKSSVLRKVAAIAAVQDAFAPPHVVTARSAETLSKVKPKRLNKRDKPADRVAVYDLSTRGKSGDELCRIEARLAAAEGMTSRRYRQRIAANRKALAKREPRLAR
ncbi:MAG: hypothetical protein ACJ8GV_10055 [Luteimonas sp.]